MTALQIARIVWRVVTKIEVDQQLSVVNDDVSVESENECDYAKCLFYASDSVSPNISSRKECEKDGSNNLVHDERDDAIESHQRSMFLVQSYIVQEERRTTMVASHALKTIGASRSQNISDTSYRKLYEKDGADKPVHDEGDDDIASHQK